MRPVNTVVKYGQKLNATKEQSFISAFPNNYNMNKKLNEVEILLVEDSLSDAELIIRALRKVNLANHVVHLKDGVEALDFIFAKGAFSERDIKKVPKVILLDIKMPRVDGIEVLRQVKSHPN